MKNLETFIKESRCTLLNGQAFNFFQPRIIFKIERKYKIKRLKRNFIKIVFAKRPYVGLYAPF